MLKITHKIDVRNEYVSDCKHMGDVICWTLKDAVKQASKNAPLRSTFPIFVCKAPFFVNGEKFIRDAEYVGTFPRIDE